MILLLKNYFKAFFQQFEKGNNNAAALAYYTLFAICPIFYFFFSMVEKLFGEDKLNYITKNIIQQFFGKIESDQILEFVLSRPYFDSSLILDFISFLILLFSCSSIMVSIKKSMNQILNVPLKKLNKKKKIKETFFRRFYSLGLLILIVVVILSFAILQMISMSFLEPILIKENLTSSFMFFFISMILSFSSNIVILYLIYKKSSDTYIDNKILKHPVFLTAFFLSLCQYFLRFYLNDYHVFSDAGLTGSVLTLLLWIYIFATFIYGGAFYLNQLRCITKD